MKSITEYLQNDQNILWQLHEKISSWTAHLIGPVVFNFGIKEEAWNMTTADLLNFPEASIGRVLGEFLKKNRLEPIAGVESHDVYHILFDFSPTLRDEIALQFFLKGNGKKSIASFGTSLGAWFLFPRQWQYFKTSYARGKECMDISKLNMKSILTDNFDQVRTSLFNESINPKNHQI